MCFLLKGCVKTTCVQDGLALGDETFLQWLLGSGLSSTNISPCTSTLFCRVKSKGRENRQDDAESCLDVQQQSLAFLFPLFPFMQGMHKAEHSHHPPRFKQITSTRSIKYLDANKLFFGQPFWTEMLADPLALRIYATFCGFTLTERSWTCMVEFEMFNDRHPTELEMFLAPNPSLALISRNITYIFWRWFGDVCPSPWGPLWPLQ